MARTLRDTCQRASLGKKIYGAERIRPIDPDLENPLGNAHCTLALHSEGRFALTIWN
jgi:hypothetical protein